MSFLTLLAVVAPVFLIVGAGYAIRRVEWLTEESDASLLRLVVNLLFPCLILDTILGNKALEQAGNIVLAPAVGFATVVLGYAVSWFAAPLFGLRDPRARRTFAFTTGLYNYGYIPLPLVQKLFDQQTAAVLFIHNVGVETALWTVGLLLISGRGSGASEQSWRRIFNVPFLAICTAITLHFLGARAWLPSWVLAAVHSIGAAAIPMGLILTGATFCDQARHVSMRGAAVDSIGACLLRLGVLPLLMLAAARWLPAPEELRRVMLIQAAMPCAVIPVILAKHYGGDPAMALRIILCTSLAGLLTIPWWIQFGMRWLGAPL
jgi:predicted permease